MPVSRAASASPLLLHEAMRASLPRCASRCAPGRAMPGRAAQTTDVATLSEEDVATFKRQGAFIDARAGEVDCESHAQHANLLTAPQDTSSSRGSRPSWTATRSRTARTRSLRPSSLRPSPPSRPPSRCACEASAFAHALGARRSALSRLSRLGALALRPLLSNPIALFDPSSPCSRRPTSTSWAARVT